MKFRQPVPSKFGKSLEKSYIPEPSPHLDAQTQKLLANSIYGPSHYIRLAIGISASALGPRRKWTWACRKPLELRKRHRQWQYRLLLCPLITPRDPVPGAALADATWKFSVAAAAFMRWVFHSNCVGVPFDVMWNWYELHVKDRCR